MPRILFLLIAGLMALPFILVLGLLVEALFTQASFAIPGSWALIDASINSIGQAAGTATIALVLGFLMALGLICLRRPLQLSMQVLLCLPSLFPPLMVLTVFFSISDHLSWFSLIGNSGIIWVQGLMNAGLAGFVIKSVITNKVLPFFPIARVMGSSRLHFWKVGLPLIRGELLEVWFYFFTIGITSFSIPLVLNDGFSTNLELFIYEQLRFTFGGGIGPAALAFTIQLAILALILVRFGQMEQKSVLFGPESGQGAEQGSGQDSSWRGSSPERGSSWQDSSWPSSSWQGSPPSPQAADAGTKPLNLLSLCFLVMFFIPFAMKGPQALASLVQNRFLFFALLDRAFTSLVLGFSVALFVAVLLGALSFCLMQGQGLGFWFRYWIAPSAAFWGLLYFRFFESYPWLVYGFALALLYFPFLFKLGLQAAILRLKAQVQVARVMGAQRNLVFWRVVLPQIGNLLILLSWLAFVWAIAEFGVAQMILPANQTWAQMGYSLLASYQVKQGFGVSCFLLVVSGLALLVMKGIYEFVYRKVILPSW
jgi:ABC-type Fe3+ transport system permease subunit